MAKICRLLIKGNFSRRFDDARKILEKVSEIDFRANYFLTPSGFLIIPWKFSSFKEAAEDSKLWVERLLKGIEINANHILIGVDSYSSRSVEKPHVELSVISSQEEWHFTGKVYPTIHQESGLIRADVESHFVELDDRVMVLCYHDLTVFNPRSDSVVKGFRKDIKEKFREMVGAFKPEVVLHHSHFTDTPRTWLSSWRNLEREINSVKHYATSGVYHNIHGERASLDEVLELTKKGEVTDAVVSV